MAALGALALHSLALGALDVVALGALDVAAWGALALNPLALGVFVRRVGADDVALRVVNVSLSLARQVLTSSAWICGVEVRWRSRSEAIRLQAVVQPVL